MHDSTDASAPALNITQLPSTQLLSVLEAQLAETNNALVQAALAELRRRLSVSETAEANAPRSDKLKSRAKGWQQCPACDRLHATLSPDSALVQAHHAATSPVAPWQSRMEDMKRDIPDILAASPAGVAQRDAMRAEIADWREFFRRQAGEQSEEREAFLRLCEALKIEATAAAYLEGMRLISELEAKRAAQVPGASSNDQEAAARVVEFIDSFDKKLVAAGFTLEQRREAVSALWTNRASLPNAE